MNAKHLESWAERALQELHELADDLEESGCGAVSIRSLINEYELIAAGREPWIAQMAAREVGTSATGLDAL